MELNVVSEGRRAGYAAVRLAEFSDRCRAGGLAITPQRIAIIRALLASADHPRADAIYERVRAQHPHISLATVHRTLETLCDIGEARKVTALHDSARYDGNVAPHHHVVCVKCRAIRDIEIPALDAMLEGRSELARFRVIGSSLEIRAVCENCRAGKPRAVAAKQVKSTSNREKSK